MSARELASLFHYTSGSGLLGILSSGQIWATDISQLNDSREFVYTKELTRRAVEDLAEKRNSTHILRIANSLCGILDSIDSAAVFVACFSELPDSLNQWRGYCPPGLGYNLGFDRSLLSKVAIRSDFTLHRCVYDPVVQAKEIYAWSSQLLSFLSQRITSQDNLDRDVLENFYDTLNKTSFASAFIKAAAIYKDPSFADEKEWRLVSTPRKQSQQVSLRLGQSMLLRYIPVQFHHSADHSVLRSICVGPTPHIDLAARSVATLDYKLKLQDGIRKSEIPYRAW